MAREVRVAIVGGGLSGIGATAMLRCAGIGTSSSSSAPTCWAPAGPEVQFAIEALRALERDGHASADVRPAVQQAFNEEVQRRVRGTVWNAGGCASYYLDRNGRNSTIFPGSTLELRRRMRFQPADFALA